MPLFHIPQSRDIETVQNPTLGDQQKSYIQESNTLLAFIAKELYDLGFQWGGGKSRSRQPEVGMPLDAFVPAGDDSIM